VKRHNKGLLSLRLDYNKNTKKALAKRIAKASLLFIPFSITVSFFTFLFSFLYIISNPKVIYSSQGGKTAPMLYKLFSGNLKTQETSKMEFSTSDPRAVIVKQFFTKHKAPLANYASTIVSEADKYNIDWRLVPAIGMCESNGGKNIPKDSFNAWGWAASEQDLEEKTGAYNNLSWEHGIARVSKGLATGYYHLINPADGIEFNEIWEIMKKYTPPSVPKGGPWAKCVWQYYQELTEFKSSI